MKFSIIVPTYNNQELTEKCLNAVRKNTKDIDYELVIVDDNSTDQTKRYLASQKDITFLNNKVNQGFAKGCNQGASVAIGEILVFLNNDTEVHPGWLIAIEQVFTKEKNVGAVGVKLVYPNGLIQHAGVVICDDHLPHYIFRQRPANFFAANEQRDYKIVTAACIAIPSEKFFEVGGFDETYKNGFEDVDLCLKFYHKGYRIIYSPKAVVTHHESVAPGRFKNEDKNLKLFVKKWGEEVPDAHNYFPRSFSGRIKMLVEDLRMMSWGPNIFGTRPAWVKVVRILYIPANKFITFAKLLLKGDFKVILVKIKGTNEG